MENTNKPKNFTLKHWRFAKKIFDEDNVDVATSYNGLAIVYNSLGKYSQAKELHEKALIIRKKIFDEDHADVLTSYKDLAIVYNSLGENSQANKLSRESTVDSPKDFWWRSYWCSNKL